MHCHVGRTDPHMCWIRQTPDESLHTKRFRSRSSCWLTGWAQMLSPQVRRFLFHAQPKKAPVVSILQAPSPSTSIFLLLLVFRLCSTKCGVDDSGRAILPPPANEIISSYLVGLTRRLPYGYPAVPLSTTPDSRPCVSNMLPLSTRRQSNVTDLEASRPCHATCSAVCSMR